MANKLIQLKDGSDNVYCTTNILTDFVNPKTHPSTHGYDFNDYTDTGLYSIGSPTIYQNVPLPSHGTLIVFYCSAYVTQFYVTTVAVYFRINASGWTNWIRLGPS